jgi:lysozyme
MTYALGTDVSFWQDDNQTVYRKVDFEQMRKNGASFVFIKKSQALFEDEDTRCYWRDAKNAGLLRGGYHFLVWEKSPEEQAEFFWSLLRNDPGELPPVVDFEWWKITPPNALVILERFLVRFEKVSNKTPMIYTAPSFWRQHGSKDGKWAQYPLWIANYGVNFPTVPEPWQRWEFWQFTSKGDGMSFGAESRNIDLNYFNGTEQDLLDRYGQPAEKPKPQPATMVRLQVTVPVLNVRQAPSSSSARVGQLAQGTIVNIEDIHVEGPARVWVKHSAGWSAIVYDGSVLMREVK